jgi:hypothetical protein
MFLLYFPQSLSNSQFRNYFSVRLVERVIEYDNETGLRVVGNDDE